MRFSPCIPQNCTCTQLLIAKRQRFKWNIPLFYRKKSQNENMLLLKTLCRKCVEWPSIMSRIDKRSTFIRCELCGWLIESLKYSICNVCTCIQACTFGAYTSHLRMHAAILCHTVVNWMNWNFNSHRIDVHSLTHSFIYSLNWLIRERAPTKAFNKFPCQIPNSYTYVNKQSCNYYLIIESLLHGGQSLEFIGIFFSTSRILQCIHFH